MINFIKHKTPFILLGVSFIFALCSYFEWYFEIFIYLADTVGYSITTNVFMFLYYNRSEFCSSTKIAIVGLLSLNVMNLLYLCFGVSGGLYDLLLLTIVFFVLIYLKFK